jgi:hypothetical protein
MASDPKANEGKHICDIRNVRMAHRRYYSSSNAHQSSYYDSSNAHQSSHYDGSIWLAAMQASTYIFYDEKVIISLQISTGVTCVIAPLCMQVA